MKQTEKELLRQLIDHQGEYLTSQYLASELLLSDRTIRNYLKTLNEVIENNGGRLIAKQGQGYQLEVVNKLAFALFLKQREVTVEYGDQVTEFYGSEDRKKYILNKLLLEDRAIVIDDLAEELYISRSSLVNDIQEIKEKLAEYSLKIVSKHKQGMWIEGQEQDKRHVIMDTFFGNKYTNSLKEYLGNSQFFKEINFEELVIVILDEIRESKLKVSDFVIQNLALHLALAIKRMRAGFEIQVPEITGEEIHETEYQAAKNITRRIESIMNVRFPKDEIAYLALHLMAKSNQNHKRENQELVTELMSVLKELAQVLGQSIVEDYQFRNGLLNHLEPMLVRLERGIALENPLTKEIKKEDPRAFELTKYYFGQMPSLKDYKINEDEWAYLALHLMAAIEKNKVDCKLQALIICATGYGSAQLLKNRVLSEFGKNIAVNQVKGYYEIDKQALENVDLIISSIDLSTMFFKVPVLHVSVFLNDQDVQKIRKVIEEHRPSCLVKPQESVSLMKEKRAFYEEQISKKWFKVYASAPTKDQVIAELLALLQEDETENYTSEMSHQIERREKMGQIIFSEQVVVPHPAIPVGATAKIAVGIIPDGMEWDEQGAIHFVFLVSPSCIENEGITVVTKAIVKFIDRLDLQQLILAEPTFENFNQQFMKMIY